MYCCCSLFSLPDKINTVFVDGQYFASYSKMTVLVQQSIKIKLHRKLQLADNVTTNFESVASPFPHIACVESDKKSFRDILGVIPHGISLRHVPYITTLLQSSVVKFLSCFKKKRKHRSCKQTAT